MCRRDGSVMRLLMLTVMLQVCQSLLTSVKSLLGSTNSITYLSYFFFLHIPVFRLIKASSAPCNQLLYLAVCASDILTVLPCESSLFRPVHVLLLGSCSSCCKKQTKSHTNTKTIELLHKENLSEEAARYYSILAIMY